MTIDEANMIQIDKIWNPGVVGIVVLESLAFDEMSFELVGSEVIFGPIFMISPVIVFEWETNPISSCNLN